MLRFIVDESIGVATEQRILVTNDKDFGDKVYRDGHSHAGIILLRLADDRVATKLHVVETLLTGYAHKIANHFVVATERAIRIR